MAKNIVLIRFSSRKEGNCAAISAYISKHHAAQNVMEYTVDESIVQPCNCCNYECLQPGKLCPNLNDAQNAIMDSISSADLVYYIIPNYCGYPCANYFVFNERSVGYYNKDRELMKKYRNIPKRFIVVSNTEGPNFESALQQQVNHKPEILYLKTSKYQIHSTTGNLMESDAAKGDLYAFLNCYAL